MADHTPATPAEQISRRDRRTPRSRMLSRRNLIVGGTALAVTLALALAAGIITAVTVHPLAPAVAAPTLSPVASIPASSGAYRPLTARQIASLPEARYNTVIPGLLPATGISPNTVTRTMTIRHAVAIYGDDQRAAIAHLAAKNFLGDPTVVVPIGVEGGWTKVLTPARQQLPSNTHGAAAAQTAGWVRTDQLHSGTALHSRIVVSASKQTLTISTNGRTISYPVGVGTAGTPTPTNVTGYLQARYLDPKQDEPIYPIQLTSLHATTKDEPFGGSDGGLIGVHFNTATTGQVSHGCIRLTAAAIAAVNQLPLGTPISIHP